ncbi:MAG TPA: carbohydrate-binding protein [Chitinolyticbacter sp.]|nr:carbohydrate-binding protein [Chitinolyticbacter sp.]
MKAQTAIAFTLASSAVFAAPAWQAGQVYQAGETITIAGLDYRAQWWTQGQDPQAHHGPIGGGQPWLVLDPNQPPLACGDVWRSQTAYNGKAVVSRLGRNYLANWWTRGNDPQAAGSREVWRDLGSCNYVSAYTYTLTAPQVPVVQFDNLTLGNDYPIEVILPPDFQPDAAYPVLYVLDWSGLRDFFLAQYQPLRDANRLQPFIVVGVGCGQDALTCQVRRARDFTPSHSADEDAYFRYVFELQGAPDAQITGSAAAFLSFLKSEVIPRVERRYLTTPAARGLHGTSFSALFAGHVLVNDTHSFGRYLINSPSLWYQNYALTAETQARPAAAFANVQRVFVSTGSAEGSPYVEDTAAFAALLGTKQLPLGYAVLDGFDHEHAYEQAATAAGLLDSYAR